METLPSACLHRSPTASWSTTPNVARAMPSASVQAAASGAGSTSSAEPGERFQALPQLLDRGRRVAAVGSVNTVAGQHV